MKAFQHKTTEQRNAFLQSLVDAEGVRRGRKLDARESRRNHG